MTALPDRLAELAVRAYPADVRAEREAEMLDTLADIRAEHPRRYAREVIDLVRLGLRERAQRTARVGVGRLVTDGLRLGVIMVMMLELADLIAHQWRGEHYPLLGPSRTVPLALILAAALVGFDRLAAGAGIVWLLIAMPELYRDKGSPIGIAPSLVPLACFVVMVVVPRTSPVDWRRPGWRRLDWPRLDWRRLDWRPLGWFAVPAALVSVLGPARLNPVLVALIGLVAVAVVAIALARAAADPRLAIACAVPAAYVGLQIVWKTEAPVAFSTIFLAALPVVMVYAIARTRSVRRTAL